MLHFWPLNSAVCGRVNISITAVGRPHHKVCCKKMSICISIVAKTNHNTSHMGQAIPHRHHGSPPKRPGANTVHITVADSWQMPNIQPQIRLIRARNHLKLFIHPNRNKWIKFYCRTITSNTINRQRKRNSFRWKQNNQVKIYKLYRYIEYQ